MARRIVLYYHGREGRLRVNGLLVVAGSAKFSRNQRK
jgi:hypothetical protein